ncbi:hypothetical protein BX667DRAFT_510254 [Coemansia mojavensis]|nr:hypothetical protein BX667DRAFT_510254 [Coemansia mojavensis]
MIIIYTDGLCVDSGSVVSSGIGVYFGPKDSHNTCAKIPKPHSALYAKLEAIYQAIIRLGKHTPALKGPTDAVICTDSQECLDIISDARQPRIPKNTSGRELSSDIADLAPKLITILTSSRYKIHFQKVDSDDPGIKNALKLAKTAACS